MNRQVLANELASTRAYNAVGQDPVALRVENAGWKTPRGLEILKPVSFCLAPGRVLGLVGANGAGKSSLLRLLYRFHKPACGRVLLDGRDLWQLSARDVARQVAVVLQEHPKDFALTVGEIVALGRLPHRRAFSAAGDRDAEICAMALERLGLQGLANRSLGTLSGGECQRVLVARALAQEPRLLVMDEPTNHLDIRHQLQVLELIRHLGLTIVVSLHDLNLAAGVCDDLLVLKDGEAIAFGPTQEILDAELVSRAFQVGAAREELQPSNRPHFTFHLTHPDR